MRKALIIATILLASCGNPDQGVRQESEDLKTFDATEEAPPAADAAMPPPTASRTDSSTPRPPGIAPTAAPGVAFNYQYAFRLPAMAIGPVQEQHAQACEKLGTDRCRITGMRYTMVEDDEIEAELLLKLDPAIARAYGRVGIEAVERAEGLLTHAEITGTDVGTQIAQGNRTEAQLREELRRIEQQLARGDLRSPERVQLQDQAQLLREQIRANEANQGERREMLARTPVTFAYRSGDTAGPIERALEQSGDNLVGGLAMLLIVLVTLLPWAAIILVIGLAIRWLRRRFMTEPVYPRTAEEPLSPPAA